MYIYKGEICSTGKYYTVTVTNNFYIYCFHLDFRFQNNRPVTINSMFNECSAVHLPSNALQVIRITCSMIIESA